MQHAACVCVCVCNHNHPQPQPDAPDTDTHAHFTVCAWHIRKRNAKCSFGFCFDVLSLTLHLQRSYLAICEKNNATPRPLAQEATNRHQRQIPWLRGQIWFTMGTFCHLPAAKWLLLAFCCILLHLRAGKKATNKNASPTFFFLVLLSQERKSILHRMYIPQTQYRAA